MNVEVFTKPVIQETLICRHSVSEETGNSKVQTLSCPVAGYVPEGSKYDRKVYPRFIVISPFNFDFKISINLTVMFYQITCIVPKYKLSSATLYLNLLMNYWGILP